VGFRVDLARNQTINRFMREAVPKGATHLLMIDNDMVPIIDTNKIISYTGDLGYCEYAGHGGSRGHRARFGAACFKVSAELLGRMSPPYFSVGVNDNCDMLNACECTWFEQNAIQAGATPDQAGIIGHEMNAVFFPDDTKRTGFSFMFPEDIAEHYPTL